jgi:hypothetical protein
VSGARSINRAEILTARTDTFAEVAEVAAAEAAAAEAAAAVEAVSAAEAAAAAGASANFKQGSELPSSNTKPAKSRFKRSICFFAR